MRPTGKLHLGHLLGVLENWVKLQDEYDCYYMVADWHALTSEYADPSEIKNDTREIVVDWLSAGLDPSKSTFFVQSHVKEHAELCLLLSMIVPLAWLERCPTYKEQLSEISGGDENVDAGKQSESFDQFIARTNLKVAGDRKYLRTYGFLGYPVLQAADILIYRADAVPVGQDQLPHLELCREISRRFNHLYSKKVFPEPASLLTPFPKIPGTDGRKMSKSYNNCIYLSDSPEIMTKKIKTMFTDQTKLRKGDPGHPESCPVFACHEIYNSAQTGKISEECKSGKLGCTDCKSILTEKLLKAMEQFRNKRNELCRHPEKIDGILSQGAEKARSAARETMSEVRQVMGI